jgi:uncharacterized protein (DUF1501 family)
MGRRDFLKAGGLALGGLSLSELLARRADAGTARRDTSVILIYCSGGASQLETYDLKPDGPEEMRSIFKPIATRVPGMAICEHFPRQARIADRFSLIRSMHHTINIHNDGSILTLTGKAPTVPDPSSQAKSEHPDLGMIATKMLGMHPAGLPRYVSIPSPFHMTRPTYLGSACQPFATGDVSQPGYTPPLLRLRGVNESALTDRRRLLGRLDAIRRAGERTVSADPLDPFREQAFDILTSPAVARAFDLEREPEKLRDRYGRHLWGQACLMARRLAEAGTSVISVIANTPKAGPMFTNWDDHPGNAMRPGHFGDYMKVRLPYFDEAVAALIEDIFERGLDRRVMVVVVGEFGRTPRLRYGPPDRSIGRDHWPDAYSALVSGGGLRMGQVVGATNARGEYATDSPVTPQDLLATIYRHLGVDVGQAFTDATGRPTPVLYAGEPIRALI